MQCFSEEDCKGFVTKFQDCLFENTYGFESNDANKVKVYRKDFIRWAKPKFANDSVWEDAEDSFLKSPSSATLVRPSHDLKEEFKEVAEHGVGEGFFESII
ncbi:Protein CYPRO4 [Camellia lanceoleosa]|uniref:Protein CYPRO4 n=1 Tax=Camellia lanceoleosa TaxID=1840588 RepID=A0ACC0IAV1_9ERIC|nr:Protein CYPRO4 [Camellia lanceoleosa]